jgi:hypothetical protein
MDSDLIVFINGIGILIYFVDFALLCVAAIIIVRSNIFLLLFVSLRWYDSMFQFVDGLVHGF